MCEWGSSREEERGGMSQIQAAGINQRHQNGGIVCVGLLGLCPLCRERGCFKTL